LGIKKQIGLLALTMDYTKVAPPFAVKVIQLASPAPGDAQKVIAIWRFEGIPQEFCFKLEI